jgi:hypothetical protein
MSKIFNSVKDAVIDQASPNINQPSDPTIALFWQSNSSQRIILHFNISGIVHKNISAKLRLTISSSSGIVNSSTAYVYELGNTNWGENTITWNSYDGTNNWSTPGGDTTDISPIAYAVASNPLNFAVHEIDITEIAKNALLSRNGQVHLLIRSIETTGTDFGELVYYSSETNYPPFLEISGHTVDDKQFIIKT